QGLYTAANFPGMPAGWIRAIYVRASYGYSWGLGSGAPCLITGFTAKIGYTSDTVYRMNQDTFRTGLTTIYGPDTLRIPCTYGIGQWFRIPVTKNNFYYNPDGAKFSLELSCSAQTDPTVGMHMIMNSILGNGKAFRKTLTSYKPTEKFSGDARSAMDRGLDLEPPLEITKFSIIAAVGLFPTPV